MRADLAVVGAGPAGMAASLAAADLGCHVTLVDAGARVGGQIYRQSDLAPPGREAAPEAGTGLPSRFHRVTGHPRIRVLCASTLWCAERHGDGFLLRIHGPSGGTTLEAAAVVIATGASEIALPFPGWELPGVTTAGAAQALLKAQHTRVGERVLVAGSGPFLLPVAAGLVTAGVRVVAVLEAASTRAVVRTGVRRAPGLARQRAKLAEVAAYGWRLLRHRVPVYTGHAVIACHGRDRVERVTSARLGPDWRPVPGGRRDLDVDAVCVTFGFAPALELIRALSCAERPHPTKPVTAAWHDGDQATSVPGVFAAGETTGVGGAEVAELEGWLAGVTAARHLGRLDQRAHAERTRPLRVRLARARSFAAFLDDIYALPTGWLGWPRPDTVVCRCEESTWEDVRRAVADGARDMRSLKGLTRCGMGYCQGRVCGPVLRHALAAMTNRAPSEVGDLDTRVIATPVPLGVIAEQRGWHAADVRPKCG